MVHSSSRPKSHKSHPSPSPLCPVCSHCHNAQSWRSFFQCILDAFKLYIFGIVELIYQIFFAVPVDIEATYSSEKKSWQSANSQSNVTLIISGATSGIGSQLLQLFHGPVHRIIVLTHPDRPQNFSGGEQVPIDFSNRRSTERAAEYLRTQLAPSPRPNSTVLFVHCAAVYNPDGAHPTLHTFQVNTFMPVRLLHHLRHVIDAIVCIGSSSQHCASPLPISSCPLHVAVSPYAAYPLSKLLMLRYVDHWAKLMDKPAIIIHPGIVATNLYRTERKFLYFILRPVIQFLGWQARHSAIRIMRLIRNAGILQNPDDGCAKPPLYWNAVTMCSSNISQLIDTDTTMTNAYSMSFYRQLGLSIPEEM